MTPLLIGIICILTLIQSNKNRFHLAIFYSLACVVHILVFSSAIGVDYYLSAGVFDFALIYGFCLYAKPGNFSDNMILISVISLALNWYGWIIYENYLPPNSYDTAFQFLYGYAILTLLKRDKADDSYVPYWLHRLLSSDNTFSNAHNSLHKEERH
jgi:hypothetical protein